MRKLAVLGSYDDGDLYQRNRVLVDVLQRLCEQTVVVNTRSRDTAAIAGTLSIVDRARALLREAKVLWDMRSTFSDCDVVFVPYPAYTSLLALWCMGALKKRLVIADAFLELHSTVVEDRGLLPEGSLRSSLLLAVQRVTLNRARCVLIDTEEQAELLRKNLERSFTQVVAVPVGIDETQWFPVSLPETTVIRVLFWGTFIPLHGVEHIVAAAKTLHGEQASIEFVLLGDGQTASSIAALLDDAPLANLSWHRGIHSTARIREELAAAHIVLGVFGDTRKADRVVPYKVHQALASNRALISRSAQATNHAIDPTRGFVSCKAADAGALALAIKSVAERLRSGWRPATRDIYDQHFGQMVIEGQLSAVLQLDGQAP